MWTEGVIRDCYTGQAEKIKGLARLLLQMMPRETVRASKLLPVSAQQIGAARTLEKFDGPLTTKLGYFRPEHKVPLCPISKKSKLY